MRASNVSQAITVLSLLLSSSCVALRPPRRPAKSDTDHDNSQVQGEHAPEVQNRASGDIRAGRIEDIPDVLLDVPVMHQESGFSQPAATSRRDLLRLRNRGRSGNSRNDSKTASKSAERKTGSAVVRDTVSPIRNRESVPEASTNTRHRPSTRGRRPSLSFSELVRSRPSASTVSSSSSDGQHLLTDELAAEDNEQRVDRFDADSAVRLQAAALGKLSLVEKDTVSHTVDHQRKSSSATSGPDSSPNDKPATSQFRQRQRERTTTISPAEIPDYDTECPERNGYFADAFQCDRYYQCSNFELSEKLCPDGLVFNDFSPLYERCDFMHAVNCSGREELQPAKPSGRCPRQNGYYPHHDPAVCDQFVQCVDGQVNPLTCPAGLVFSTATGTCQWPDKAGRTGCSSKDVLKFTCPNSKPIDVRTLAPGQPLHPRFPDVEDCRFFFTCIEGVTPRRHGCQNGQVFNAETKACDEPENVPECYDETVDSL